MRRPLLLFCFTLFASPSLRGQAPQPAPGAVETITTEDLRSRIGILADDSMMGRDTPGPGLERAAAYVIGELHRLGLQPAGDEGTYTQRFGVSRWIIDTAGSRLRLQAGAAQLEAGFGGSARFVGGGVPARPLRGSAVLLAGPLTRQAAANPWLRRRIVLVAVDHGRPLPDDLGERIDQIAASARAVILLSNRDSAARARRTATSLEPRLTPDFRDGTLGAPVVELADEAAAKLLAAAHVDLSRLRSVARPEAREVSGLRIELRLARRYIERTGAPNLIAVLEGSDPVLRREYVAVSAHLDHVGVGRGPGDSIYNGADDNASGVAGLLELAEAFADNPPRRSLLFVLPSGEEKGLWGSDYFTSHPTVPLERVVADINLDLIGRNWPDSVIAVGPELSTLGETLRRTVEAHAELRMTPIADRWPEERIFYRSDHYNFARRGVPVLFFTSGTHPDYHQPSDAVDRIDAEKASRLVRLLYHVTSAVADAPDRPKWNSRPE